MISPPEYHQLKWRGDGDWAKAGASRAIGGEYMVRRVYDPEARRYLENTFLAGHRRTGLGPYGPGERLGTASTIEEAKAIAQAAHDKARASARGEIPLAAPSRLASSRKTASPLRRRAR